MLNFKLISFEIGQNKTSDSATELTGLMERHKKGETVSIEQWRKAGLPASKRLLERHGIAESLPLLVGEVKSGTKETPTKFASTEEIENYLNRSQFSDANKRQLEGRAKTLLENDFTDKELDEVLELSDSSWEEKNKQGIWVRGDLNISGTNAIEITLQSSGRKILCQRYERGPKLPLVEILYCTNGKHGPKKYLSLIKGEAIDKTQKRTGEFNSIEELKAYLEHYRSSSLELNKADKKMLINNARTLFDNNVTREEMADIIRLIGKSWEEKAEWGRRVGGLLSGVDNVEIELKSSRRKIICLRYKVDTNPTEEMAFYTSGGSETFYLRHLKP